MKPAGLIVSLQNSGRIFTKKLFGEIVLVAWGQCMDGVTFKHYDIWGETYILPDNNAKSANSSCSINTALCSSL